MSLSLINHLLQSYGYFAGFAFIALDAGGHVRAVCAQAS